MIIQNPEVLKDEEIANRPRVRLISDASSVDGAFSVQNVKLFNGDEGALPHFHKISTEMFYVVEGLLDFWEDGKIHQLNAGDCAVVRPLTPHAFGALRGHDADVLVVVAPGVERFEYFRILSEVVRGTLPSDSLHKRQEEFDTYFVQSDQWAAHRARRTEESGMTQS